MLDKAPIRTPPGARLMACPPCALVIFGATGDLTKRLVVPALYNLSRSKVLPKQFALIGVAGRTVLPTAGVSAFMTC